MVIDASVALSWCFPNEHTPELLEVLVQSQRSELIVPSIWPIEVANVLSISFRRKRIDESGIEEALKLLEALSIHVAVGSGLSDVRANLSTSLPAELTAYDAEYLRLAAGRRLPLATLDKELRVAATHAGIPVLP